ncbi:MAG: low-complexity protein [Burkholderiales bacterium]|nr:low-complexity protein [Burkholderiales bacterium]
MKSKTAATFAFGSALAASLAAMPIANAAGNPFALESLSSGYQVADGDKKADGKCGEGKCGASKAEGAADKKADGKSGEGKCGATSHGPTSASDKKVDGKCGEGKCGASKK